MAWSDVTEVERTGTGFGPIVLWMTGIDLTGKDAAGKRCRIGVPGSFHPNDQDLLEAIIIERTPWARHK